MDLHKVRGMGCILYYPIEVTEREEKRGREGYVVDLDAPLERAWAESTGQLYKLEPAPEAKGPSAISNKQAIHAIQVEAQRLATVAAEAAEKAALNPAPAVGAQGAATGAQASDASSGAQTAVTQTGGTGDPEDAKGANGADPLEVPQGRRRKAG